MSFSRKVFQKLFLTTLIYIINEICLLVNTLHLLQNIQANGQRNRKMENNCQSPAVIFSPVCHYKTFEFQINSTGSVNLTGKLNENHYRYRKNS